MVYTGRPSPCCLTCRAKRRKCDLVRPGCTQCLRAGVPCPGYRDSSIIVFKDVSRHVADKVQKQKAQRDAHRLRLPVDAAHPPSWASSPSPSHAPSSPDKETDESPLLPLSPKLFAKDVAVSFFLSFYLPESAFSDFSLVFMYSSIDAADPALVATALAAFSSQFMQPGVLEHAQSHYAKAIKMTNAALASPEHAKEDSTLVSILLLAVFEAHMFRGRSSPHAWITHTYGAAALLEHRGLEQFDTDLGQALFVHASINIRMLCIQRRLRVPPAIGTLQRQVEGPRFSKDLRWHASLVLETAAEFLWEVEPSKVMSEAELGAIIDRALEIDAEAVVLMDGLSVAFPYWKLTETRLLDDSYETRPIGWYSGPRAARFWNNMRHQRLFFNNWICEAIYTLQARLQLVDASISEPLLEVAAQSARTVEEMAHEILATVPFILESPALSLSARNLIWPMTAIAISKYAPPTAREFIPTFLRKLSDDYSIQQASFAADMIEDKANMEDWLHLCQLS